MSRPIHFISKSIPGYGTNDAIYLPRPNSSRGDYTIICNVNLLSLRCCFRHTSICNASSSYYRRNPDFSKQNKHGFSHSKNRSNEEINGYGQEFEESEVLTSKNGPVLGNHKFQATAIPGPREKEIVELFRKVQAQLRERSAMKEEKNVENSRGKSKESETVDSLLKLLRKHSVQQGNITNSSANNRDFILDQPEQVDSLTEESVTLTVKHEMQESPRSNPSRPKSNFSRRSPVPEMKFQPVYSCLEAETDDSDDIKVESDTEPLLSKGNVFDEMSEDETSELGESEHENGEDEQNRVEVSDVSGMKLVELRAIAKSRGVKGFSKLKKNELIELLRGSSA